MNLLLRRLSGCLLTTAALHAAPESFHWGNVAIGGGGFVSAVVPSPLERNLFYARTDVGGAYRWEESGKQWIALNDDIGPDELGLWGIEALAIDPKTPGKVYAMAGTIYWNMVGGRGRSAFLRSSDHGRTWERVFVWDASNQQFNANGNGMGRGTGERLAVDPNNPDVMFYGSRDRGLWKSGDNGSSWTHVDAFTKTAGSDTTWNGCGFSFVQFAPGDSRVLYAGFLRESPNVFRSVDGGATWEAIPVPTGLRTTAGGASIRLMPQRLAQGPGSHALFVTFADGAGPHTMAWNEGWGPIWDGFGRGAILRYDLDSSRWTDVSPEDLIDDKATGSSKYDKVDLSGGAYEYLAPYGGIAVNPADPLEMVATDMGYRGPQFWKLDASGKKWKDVWGSNIYHTRDGGRSWVKSFQYYWMDGGVYPTSRQMDENGIGWLFQSAIHWSGCIAFDPFDPKRVFVTSGNGMYLTENIRDYTYTPPVNSWDQPVLEQRQVWKVASHGIEETVPLDLVSIPGGPLVSVIGDYDGFRHNDVLAYPATAHRTGVNGTPVAMGTTRALAWASLSGRLVKVSDRRTAQPDAYSNVPVSPLQFSDDSGTTWKVNAYENLDTSLSGASSVAISADGEATLWTPAFRSGKDATLPVMRYATSAWSTVSGIDGAWLLGDPVDASTFYAFQRDLGSFYRSTDKGAHFTKVGNPSPSGSRKFRAVPGRKGDLWLPITSGGKGFLARSQDGGATWTSVGGFSDCQAVGFGKGVSGSSFPTVFAQGTSGGVSGLFQSDDSGATWRRIDDDAHRYGTLANGEFVVGDMNTHGVVYRSTAGRGIAALLPGGTTTSLHQAPPDRSTSWLYRVRISRHGKTLEIAGLEGRVHLELRSLDGRLETRRELEAGRHELRIASSALRAVRLTDLQGESRTVLR